MINKPQTRITRANIFLLPTWSGSAIMPSIAKKLWHFVRPWPHVKAQTQSDFYAGVGQRPSFIFWKPRQIWYVIACEYSHAIIRLFSYYQIPWVGPEEQFVLTLWHGTDFRITGPLWRKSIMDYHHKRSVMWMFYLRLFEQTVKSPA